MSRRGDGVLDTRRDQENLFVLRCLQAVCRAAALVERSAGHGSQVGGAHVCEWCADWSSITHSRETGWEFGDYPTGDATDPIGLASGTDRVIRGGSWRENKGVARSAYRSALEPDNWRSWLGFRLCLKEKTEDEKQIETFKDKIKKLVSSGEENLAIELIRSNNSPELYQELLDGCSIKNYEEAELHLSDW